MGESLCIEAVAALVVWTGHPNEIAATWIPNFERVGQSLTQHLKKEGLQMLVLFHRH